MSLRVVYRCRCPESKLNRGDGGVAAVADSGGGGGGSVSVGGTIVEGVGVKEAKGESR